MSPPLSIVLELTRIAEPDDPHAFRFEPQGYTLRGPVGGLERFDIPWSPQLLADLDEIRRPGRDPALIQRVGSIMQRALRPIGWTALGEQIRAASEAGRPVVVTLRSNAAELYALPWELVTVGPGGQHLCELPGVLLRQEWPATTTAAESPSPRPDGSRVLFAWSAAGGAVPAAEHQRALAGTCFEGHVRFDLSKDVQADVSAARLAEVLADAEAAGQPFAVLHLLCHGGRAGSTFGLVLSDDDGSASVVDGGRLRQLLAPHARTLRLVVLAACDGGNIGDYGNHLGSVAQALHRGGIQSVIASRVQTMRPGATPRATLEAIFASAPADRPLLLVVDQFEELFTHTGDPAERAAFARRLWSLASVDSGLHVLVTLRVDFLGRCGDLILDDTGLSLDRVAYDEAHRVAVARMGPEQVRDVLERPADRVGLRFAPGLLDRILADVGTEPGALPLLQYALGRLWARREGHTLPAATYEAMGGLVGALEKDADELVGSLDAEQQRQARKILVRLVDTRDDEAVDTRRRVQLDHLQPPEEEEQRAVFEAVLARLVDARLVVRSEDEHEKTRTLEIAHEALIRRWGVLRRWIGEDREKLAELERLRVWSEHQTLLTGNRLDRALEFVHKHDADVDAPVRAFVEASERERRRSEAEREAQRRRRRRIVIAVISALSMLLVLAIGLGVWALGAQAEAEGEARRALLAARKAQSAQLVARSRLDLMTGNATTAALLLAEETDPGASEGWLQAAVDTASQPIARSLLHGHEGKVVSASFSSEGRSILTASDDGTARVWRADGTGEPVVLRGHEKRVVSASFSPDGHSVVTASWDLTARVWRADGSGDPVILRGHEKFVTSALFSPDGRRVVTASDDGSARVWRVDGSGEPVTFGSHEKPVVSASFSPDGSSVVTAAGKTLRVWRADGLGEPVVLQGHEDDLVSVSFSRDGRSIVAASGRTACVWSVDAPGKPVVLRGHELKVTSASFSPDDRHVVTTSWDTTARVWRADGSGQPFTLQGHERTVTSASFSSDGRSIVTASMDKTVRVWRLDGSEKPLVLRGHVGEVRSASFSPDGRSVVTASDDGSAGVWLAGDPDEGHANVVSSTAFSPDGNHVVTTARDNTARVWRADGSGELVVLRGHEKAVTSASFSPDSRSVVTASDDGTARVWRADGSGESVVLRGHEDRVVSASFSPDGRGVVTGSTDGTARVWRADGSGEPVILRGHKKAMLIMWASFSPDGLSVVTFDGTVRVWRVDGTGEPVVVPGRVVSGSLSPDGRHVVTTSRDDTVRIVRVDGTGEPVALRGHEGMVWFASFSPDGRDVVTTSMDNTARVWRTDGTGEPVVLRGHEKVVVSASFSPDGRSVITASDDGTARVWRSDGTGESLVLRGHEVRVVSASFSPDGLRVLTAPWRYRTARVWTIDPPTLRDELRARTNACLTPEQRKSYLGEPLADATTRWEQCERDHGRTLLPQARTSPPFFDRSE